MRSFVADHLPALAWALVVAALLATPSSALPEIPSFLPEWVDKPVHLILFLIQTLLAGRSLAARGRLKSPAAAAALLSLAYALLLELAQIWIPGRGWAARDLAADAAGVALGWLGSALWSRGAAAGPG